MTLEKLKTNTRKELAALAKRHQVAGWHGMRKEELIEALLDVQRSTVSSAAAPSSRGSGRMDTQRLDPNPSSSNKLSPTNYRGLGLGETNRRPTSPRSSAASRTQTARVVRRDISTVSNNESVQEELTATAHDPYWIHAQWTLKRSTVLRAEAALGSDWFRAYPVIRVYAVKVDEVNGTSTQWLRDVEIHGECDHWFVPVENPPGAFKLEVGYLTPNGKFFALAKSRKVTTPRPGSRAAERLGFQQNANARPARSTVTDPEFEKYLAARATCYASPPSDGQSEETPQDFSLDAELIVTGVAKPNCQFTLQGESVKVGKDGKFKARVSVADGRQVIPATYTSADGAEKRTIFLAVERNTKSPRR